MKSLSFDAILAALATLSITAGCSRGAEMAPAPETNAPAQVTPPRGGPTTESPPGANVAPPGPGASAPAGRDVAPPADEKKSSLAGDAVDAGVEVKPPPPPGRAKPASASCGASGCSPDMKKGGK